MEELPGNRSWLSFGTFVPNSHVGILMPDVMVLGGRALERHLGHEDGALLSGISTFVKGPRRHASCCEVIENTSIGLCP